MTDQRLIDIESKLAHQEHTIAELNDVVTSQQAQLSNLETLVSALRDRVRSLSDAGPTEAAEVEIPPHY